jgi:hypothetical protein
VFGFVRAIALCVVGIGVVESELRNVDAGACRRPVALLLGLGPVHSTNLPLALQCSTSADRHWDGPQGLACCVGCRAAAGLLNDEQPPHF